MGVLVLIIPSPSWSVFSTVADICGILELGCTPLAFVIPFKTSKFLSYLMLTPFFVKNLGHLNIFLQKPGTPIPNQEKNIFLSTSVMVTKLIGRFFLAKAKRMILFQLLSWGNVFRNFLKAKLAWFYFQILSKSQGDIKLSVWYFCFEQKGIRYVSSNTLIKKIGGVASDQSDLSMRTIAFCTKSKEFLENF